MRALVLFSRLERPQSRCPKPYPAIEPNSHAFEINPVVKPTGFREYDARWWFGHPGSDKPPELNLMGVQALGLGLLEAQRQAGLYDGERGDAIA